LIRLSAPLVYSIEITSKCDSFCPGCGNVFPHARSRNLKTEELERIIYKIKPFAGEIRITGGEPTLHPQFFNFLSILEEAKIDFHLFTHARWRDKENMLEHLRSLKHLKSILVSLHGARYETHNVFSANTTLEIYQRILENIEYMTSNGIAVNTNTVMGAYNLLELEEIAKLAFKLGAKNAAFARYIGPFSENLSFNLSELQNALYRLETMREMGLAVILGNCIPNCFYPSNASGCLAGISFCTIDPEGNIRPCNHSPSIFGNILHEDICKIWNSSGMKEWAEWFPQECDDCRFIAICPAGCKAITEILECDKDPLIMGSVRKVEGAPRRRKINIDETLCPSPLYIIRKEPFGLALISGNQFLPVDSDAIRMLKMINGKTSLKVLKQKFGNIGMNFIFFLFERGLIYFK